MTRKEAYKKLVTKRKNCRICSDSGLTNPACVEGGVFDSDQIGPWSCWQGNLNAEIMVVGQDWGGVEYFRKYNGDDTFSGNPTEANLRELFTIFGIKIDEYGMEQEQTIFLTNLILCLKNGNCQAPIKDEWLCNCSEAFFKQLIEIIKPKIIIALGKRVAESILISYSKRKPRSWTLKRLMQESLKAPYFCLTGSTYLFPAYHCGAGGVNRNRKINGQAKDWKNISEWYFDHNSRGNAMTMGEGGGQKLYTYSVHCIFNFDHWFSESDIQNVADSEGAYKAPTNSALQSLKGEIYKILSDHISTDEFEIICIHKNVSEYITLECSFETNRIFYPSEVEKDSEGGEGDFSPTSTAFDCFKQELYEILHDYKIFSMELIADFDDLLVIEDEKTDNEKMGEDSWFNDDDDDEFNSDPAVQIDKARLYLSMGLTDEELRESLQIEQQYIDRAKELGPVE